MLTCGWNIITWKGESLAEGNCLCVCVCVCNLLLVCSSVQDKSGVLSTGILHKGL